MKIFVYFRCENKIIYIGLSKYKHVSLKWHSIGQYNTYVKLILPLLVKLYLFNQLSNSNEIYLIIFKMNNIFF